MMNYQRFSLVLGFSVWLMATVIVRLYGPFLFHADDLLIVISLFLAVVPVLYILMFGVYKRFQLAADQRLKSAVLMAVPGMLCDVFCLKYHDIVFPGFSQDQAILLSSWVLWAYAFVLLIGLVSSVKKQAVESSNNEAYI